MKYFFISKSKLRFISIVFSSFAVLTLWFIHAHAVVPDAPHTLETLKGKIPKLPNLKGIVTDREAAIALGKMFFWDQQAGSDGQACASCHFAGGADTRIKNQYSPGLLDLRFPGGDLEFGGLTSVPNDTTDHNDLSPLSTAHRTASGSLAGPNYLAKPEDFPFHQLADPLDRDSAILYTTNDVFSSQGVRPSTFVDLQKVVIPHKTATFNEVCVPELDASFIFHRKVGPRNTPTNINAVFNFRSFWDGRANNIFNGFDPFGNRSDAAFVLQNNKTGVKAIRLALKNASLASQSLGPPLSAFEMTCGGKTFPKLGRKMLSRQPLAWQDVHNNDSVLGQLLDANGKIPGTYSDRIRAAFNPKWWNGHGRYSRDNEGNIINDPKGYTQKEINFSMFWGIAIMLYESTLVSNDSPFDNGLLAAAEQRGQDIFIGKGKCVNCHSGALFNKSDEGRIERMLMSEGNTQPAFYDNAFYNIGVIPTVTDLGVGDNDPFGNPLSFTRQFIGKKRIDNYGNNPCEFEILILAEDPCNRENQQVALKTLKKGKERQAVNGAFKTPTLRNVGLTPPYFHTGGYATLESVIDFYNRGGNRRGHHQPSDRHDTSGTGMLGKGDPVAKQHRGSNLDPDITPLNLTNDEKSDLIAFLKSLTDERLACSRAPFDHPSLKVFHGTDEATQIDLIFTLPATGGTDGLQSCRPNSGNLFQEAAALPPDQGLSEDTFLPKMQNLSF
ncbi:cytochrome-c peroxidase [Nitrosomonas sp. Is37]|uniref:cytochrome-c peroxidase n=1 Tax=Nitrosomonas sp. Is37 TaxID=3080535 RepID=UPI00294ABEE0|nr:cytochrome c peroxidase [Nitrosomonas sp. Is37]MDV6343332.1 cytochrome c peroxidase [Nitrosomonas sp. Is37]